MDRNTICISEDKQSSDPIVHSIEEDCMVDISIGVAARAVIYLFLHATSVDIAMHIAKGGSAYVYLMTLAEKAHHTLRSNLDGSHATSDIDWVFYANGMDRQNVSATNIFGAADGAGEINLKGVVEGTAHVTCDGCIEISEHGKETNTYLHENVLMLDETAKVHALPRLEIKTNDVKASHSASVSKVTTEDLFYFASRGIAEQEARKMYVLGFLGDLTKKVEDEGVRQRLVGAIEEKYGR